MLSFLKSLIMPQRSEPQRKPPRKRVRTDSGIPVRGTDTLTAKREAKPFGRRGEESRGRRAR
ncbi:hypothetical protein [Synechococcus phage Yong-M2-251]|nr:hypothetical protein [Synechococcus phage Yong-M2-251]